MRAAVARMQPEDSTYWFVREAFGWSVVLQMVWRFERPPEPAALAAFNERLASGVLNRRLIRPATPFARPHWVRSEDAPDLLIDDGPIGADAVERWAGVELDATPLDPETGPTWRLRTAEVDDGGAVLSLTTLHLVADGRAMVTAAAAALADTAADPLAPRRPPVGAAALVADATDALHQVTAAGVGVLRAALSTVRNRSATTEPMAIVPKAVVSKTEAHVRAPRARYSWTTVSVEATAWQEAARAHGGTSNTLFIAVLAGALRAARYVPPGAPLKVGIPVSRRGDGDERANATAGVSVLLTDDPGMDLTALRAQCKAAFTRLAEGHRAPHIHLLPLLSLLPTALVVRAATAGSGMPDVVASNLGEFAPELARVGTVSASAVAFRGIAQGVEPAEPYRFGDGVQSWCVQVGTVLTFSVVAFDEQHFPRPDDLRGVLARELTRWGVAHRMW
ncbi:hypothetical protein [Nocardia callitridis]|uniref:Diacylglycerol O-acyltransferase n=1 Tax=Nocardia callitridis TaxID=648753 RepID=A0ABP9KQP9_9NOCA